MTMEIPKRNAYNLGQLYYMMERSVAVSGYLLGHNPFIQPGVRRIRMPCLPSSENQALKRRRSKWIKTLKRWRG